MFTRAARSCERLWLSNGLTYTKLYGRGAWSCLHSVVYITFPEYTYCICMPIRLFSPAPRVMHATLKALRYRGVHWANNMFVVTHFDKHGTKEWLTLGKFTSADEAARCYDKHVKATDGTKAKLNFPDLTASTGDKKYYDIVCCTVVLPYRPVALLLARAGPGGWRSWIRILCGTIHPGNVLYTVCTVGLQVPGSVGIALLCITLLVFLGGGGLLEGRFFICTFHV